MSCISVKITRVGGDMKCRMGRVCGTSLGMYDVLWVYDGQLNTIREEPLLVKKKHKRYQ